MMFSDDEPRKVPKPISFDQNPLLNPTVPEVSLILQDDFNTISNKNEYQTYNTWKWKNTAIKEKNSRDNNSCLNSASKEKNPNNSCINLSDCSVLKDKYFKSDIEKRKNEILYGQIDEPRRPLPPRPNPMIPDFKTAQFSESSIRWHDDDEDVIVYKSTEKVQSKEKKDGYGDMDKIISNQNRQLTLLQKQIEQLLKSQEIKEKQIEQLLKSVDSKESKIEQLLQVQEMKEKQIEQLLRSQEKKENQIEQLVKAQEIKEKQKYDLLMKLKEKENEKKSVRSIGVMTRENEKKSVRSIGVMTEVEVADKNVSTNFECGCKREKNESNCNNKGTSESLNMGEIATIQEPVPTPQSSIHIDIQDYKDSSDDESDDSASRSKLFGTPIESNSMPLGYTFYNNVMTQVKDILENSNEKEKEKEDEVHVTKEKVRGEVNKSPVLMERNGHNLIRDVEYVEKRTVEPYQVWDMNHYERENISPRHNEMNLPRDTPYLPQFEYNYIKEVQSPTDISLKMNALAIKYLKREQISQYSAQLQQTIPRQHDVTIYNVTNLSIGTMRYLERHKILPNNKPEPVNPVQDVYSPEKFLRQKKKLQAQDNYNSSVGNILDINCLFTRLYRKTFSTATSPFYIWIIKNKFFTKFRFDIIHFSS